MIPAGSFAAARLDEVRRYGEAAAILLGIIRFVDDPQISHAEIAEATGWSRSKAGRTIQTLLDAGAIIATAPDAGRGVQTRRYFADLGHDATAPPVGQTVPPVEQYCPTRGKSTSLQEVEENLLSKAEPMPDEIVPVPGQLGLGLDEGTPTRLERVHLKTSQRGFALFWSRWPAKLGRKKDAMRAWDRLMAQGVTTRELHEQLDLYLEAFTWWNSNHPQHPVRQLHCTTFLNSARHDYEEKVAPADKADERWGHLLDRDQRHRRRPAGEVYDPLMVPGSPERQAMLRAQREAAEAQNQGTHNR